MAAKSDLPATTSRYLRFGHPGAFSSAVSAMYRPVVFESAPRGRFSGTIGAYQVEDLLVTHVDATTHEFRHEGSGPAPDADPVKVFVPVEGVAVLRQREQEVALRPGTLGLVDTAQTYWIHGDHGFDCLILMLPRNALGLEPDAIAELAAARLGAGSLEGVVVPYLSGLARNLDVLAGASGRRVAHTTVELLSTLLHAELGPRLSVTGAQRADLRQRAHAYVREHLDDRTLSPSTIAAALHVSPRYVQSLFSETGTTVTGFVRAQRLDASRRDLADPLLAHIGIADVAARWGFADGPHFTRAFKQAFGMTPSQYRRAAGAVAAH
ncbi:AraC family transcriptional regulator [Nocardioides sp. DS6]|uniref:AraC family transcriptional regulator n=1 Tax=Nocardioides eburneus TaxID=3231482 RepID=A0ABV3SZ62_9ACTN